MKKTLLAMALAMAAVTSYAADAVTLKITTSHKRVHPRARGLSGLRSWLRNIPKAV
jgi:hypothetical protein